LFFPKSRKSAKRVRIFVEGLENPIGQQRCPELSRNALKFNSCLLLIAKTLAVLLTFHAMHHNAPRFPASILARKQERSQSVARFPVQRQAPSALHCVLQLRRFLGEFKASN